MFLNFERRISKNLQVMLVAYPTWQHTLVPDALNAIRTGCRACPYFLSGVHLARAQLINDMSPISLQYFSYEPPYLFGFAAHRIQCRIVLQVSFFFFSMDNELI